MIFLVGVFSLLALTCSQDAFSETIPSSNNTSLSETIPSSNNTSLSETIPSSNNTSLSETIPSSNNTSLSETIPSSNNTKISQTPFQSKNPVLDEIFSWRLYDFSPDQLSFVNTTRIMEGPTGHSLFLDGNSNRIRIDSAILNNSNHVIFSAKIKPHYDGASHYTILSSTGFEFGLKNVGQEYYAELSIYDGKDWHTMQSAKPIQEEWSYVFGFYDGKTMMIDTNGAIRELPLFITNLPDLVTTTGENFTSNFDKNEQTKLHFDIGASLSHLGYFDYFSGQIDDMLVYPTNI